MAGLLNQIAGESEGPDKDVAVAGDPSVVPEDGEESNVTDEEQAAKDAFVEQGFALMYDGGQVNPYILKLLDDDPTDIREIFGEVLPLDDDMWATEGPVIALAATAVVIVLEVLRRMGPENQPEGDIIFHGGKEILEDIAEIARVAKKREYTPEELGEAMRKGADLFREAASQEGMIDLDAATAEFDEIVQADREGRINDILPQLGAAQ
jgi:hypothetical protein